MMNFLWVMVDRRKALSFVSSRDLCHSSRHHCQRSSPSLTSDTPLGGLNLRRAGVQASLNEVVQ